MNQAKIVPRIPAPMPKVTPRIPPGQLTIPTSAAEQETLAFWLAGMMRNGVKNLPKMAKTLAIQLGIVAAVNFVLWPLNTWRLPGFLAKLVGALVFLTATYNNLIPKTIYWVIVFTFGKRLYLRVRSEGLTRALAPLKAIVPEVMAAKTALRDKAYTMLLFGGGLGLIVANNFASYSRFSGARNKMDKYFVVIVISFAVSYLLGESRQGWIFKFARLVSADIARLVKKPVIYTDNHTFLLLSGFVGGLLLDAPIILMGIMYGGYILGVLCIGAALALPHISTTGKAK